MSDDIRKQYAQLDEKLRPYWEQLIRAAHAEGLLVSGFIWGDPVPDESDDPYLIRFGNVVTSSVQEMFAIHYQLSVMAAKLELAGKVHRTETPTDLSAVSAATFLSQTPLEIADKLALALLISPDIAPEIQEVLAQYMACRRPPTLTEPKL